MSGFDGRPSQPGGPLQLGPTQVRITLDDPLTAAWGALESVYDPELCLDVVSLGLVYDVRDEDGTVVVEMTLTTPGCPASESLPEMAQMAVQGAVDPTPVEVRVVWDPPWNPAMMNDNVASSLGFRLR